MISDGLLKAVLVAHLAHERAEGRVEALVAVDEGNE